MLPKNTRYLLTLLLCNFSNVRCPVYLEIMLVFWLFIHFKCFTRTCAWRKYNCIQLTNLLFQFGVYMREVRLSVFPGKRTIREVRFSCTRSSTFWETRSAKLSIVASWSPLSHFNVRQWLHFPFQCTSWIIWWPLIDSAFRDSSTH